MNTDVFLDQFAPLIETKGGVQKLRNLILQLGVREQLTEHDSEDSATVLTEKMRADKTRKMTDGLIKKSKPLPRVKSAERPFVLPKNWGWARIGDAVHLVNGKAFKPHEWSEDGLPIIRIQNLNKPTAPFNYCNFDVPEKFHVREDDFFISWSGTPGTSFGAFIWDRGHAVLNQHIFRAELHGPAFEKPFLRYAINSQLDAMIAQAHGGVGLRHITKGKLEHLPIPLPPLVEQQRIVAKVDELMRLCDQLEWLLVKRETVRGELLDAMVAGILEDGKPSGEGKANGRAGSASKG